jgi:hypothetical protein
VSVAQRRQRRKTQVIAMPKKASYPRKMEVWVPEEIADGFELLAQKTLVMSVSDHVRQALLGYLGAAGIQLAPRPQARPNGNGHHPQQQPQHGAQG